MRNGGLNFNLSAVTESSNFTLTHILCAFCIQSIWVSVIRRNFVKMINNKPTLT